MSRDPGWDCGCGAAVTTDAITDVIANVGAPGDDVTGPCESSHRTLTGLAPSMQMFIVRLA